LTGRCAYAPQPDFVQCEHGDPTVARTVSVSIRSQPWQQAVQGWQTRGDVLTVNCLLTHTRGYSRLK
jgi:hypothetical protein